MSCRILKYKLQIISDQLVEMPRGSWILKVDNQRGDLCLWAMTNIEETETTFRHIEILGTGQVVSGMDGLVNIGTVVIEPYVWHVFEKNKGEPG